MDLKKNKKKLIIISIIILISVAIFIFVQKPTINKLSNPVDKNKTLNIEDVPGVTGVKKFTDANKISVNKSSLRKNATTKKPVPTPTPLPYPRITINYSLDKTKSVREIKAEDNNSYIIASLEIRNYGYKYFDANPIKFRLGDLKPLLNISTGEMLNTVIPNNSRAQGDLVFLVNKNQIWSSKMDYIYGSYTIIYKRGTIQGTGQSTGGRRVISSE